MFYIIYNIYYKISRINFSGFTYDYYRVNFFNISFNKSCFYGIWKRKSNDQNCFKIIIYIYVFHYPSTVVSFFDLCINIIYNQAKNKINDIDCRVTEIKFYFNSKGFILIPFSFTVIEFINTIALSNFRFNRQKPYFL